MLYTIGCLKENLDCGMQANCVWQSRVNQGGLCFDPFCERNVSKHGYLKYYNRVKW